MSDEENVAEVVVLALELPSALLEEQGVCDELGHALAEKDEECDGVSDGSGEDVDELLAKVVKLTGAVKLEEAQMDARALPE